MAAAASLIVPSIGPQAGVATIHSKEDKSSHTLHIVEEDEESGVRTFSAYTPMKDGYAWMGELKITWLRTLPDGKFGSKKDAPIYGARTRYGFAEKTHTLSKVYIELLQSFENETYKGVGTALMQVAVETSFHLGCQGRLILDATFNSHPFWYKMGMRSLLDHSNDRRVLQRNRCCKK